MKNFKVRFWKDNKYMVTSQVGCLTGMKNIFSIYSQAPIFPNETPDITPKPDNYILMLYTGFKDSNGDEVCEGDLVLYTPEYMEIEGYDGVIFEVLYDENNACFGVYPWDECVNKEEWTPNEPMPFFGCPPGYFKIIGNKYEGINHEEK